MYLLGVDTATEACSVAIWRDGELSTRFEIAGRHHSERVLPMIQDVLAEAGLRLAQIDGFVAGIGPGSFVGVRVGVGLIKGLALATDRPCVGISSLELLARAAIREGAQRIAVAIDARMSELYYAAYEADASAEPHELQPATVCAPEALQLPARVDAAVGTGWAAYPAAAERLAPETCARCAHLSVPDIASGMASAAAALAAGKGADAGLLEPLYLRNRIALTLAEQRAQRS